ncbi:MAG: hypothetical protein IIA87_01905 [Nanoarchaeota archaeon]|nr:hypothetical protein [Nanoarchaeota archaeon]
MVRVLYADNYRIPLIGLGAILEQQGFNVDCTNSENAEKEFNEKFRDRLGDYDVLIAHLGVEFNGEVRKLLTDFPNLSIALVSEFPKHYSEHSDHKRVLVCDYDAPELIYFIKRRIQAA